MTEASRNAERFCRVAALLGIKAICFLSDAAAPYQPFIGRGEALVALWTVLAATPVTLLRTHDRTCYAMAYRLSFHHSGHRPPRPTAAAMREALRQNVEAQGSTIDAVEDHVHMILAGHDSELVAQAEGFFHVDLNAIRSAIVGWQAAMRTDSVPYSDPCGVVLKAEHGDYVRTGDILATVRCCSEFISSFRNAVAAALAVQPQPPSNCGFLEVAHG